jgi:hypothetical protein
MHISKKGDPYLRTLLVQGAHHILGPFGADSDLRRWGLKLAEAGGAWWKEREETRHHCHRKKTGGLVASLVGQRRSVRTLAKPQPTCHAGGSVVKNIAGKERPSSGAEFFC